MRIRRSALLVAWSLVAVAISGSDADVARAGGSTSGSLRGALEALQRRQRGRLHADPMLSYVDLEAATPKDYDTIYALYNPYQETDGEHSEEIKKQNPLAKYVVQVIGNEKPLPDNEYFDYKIVNKKEHNHSQKRKSAFRERAQHHSDNDRLEELFAQSNEVPSNSNQYYNDAQYAQILEKIWSKFKDENPPHYVESVPHGIIKLYKEREIEKRKDPGYMRAWGPVAYKKKRSSDNLYNDDDETDDDYPVVNDYRKYIPVYETDSGDDEDYEDDLADSKEVETYTIGQEPGERIQDSASKSENYRFNVEERFPVTKRSSNSPIVVKKRLSRIINPLQDNKAKYIGNIGTDPKVFQDLSQLFDEMSEDHKVKPVKRNAEHEESPHDSKPPQMTIHSPSHNNTSDHLLDDTSHEHHGHGLHHPTVAKEAEIEFSQEVSQSKQPIAVRKKSIKWSDYFGIDKRNKVQFPPNMDTERLRQKYLKTFNEEVFHRKAKRHLIRGDMQKSDNSNSAQGTQETTLNSASWKSKDLDGMSADDTPKHYDSEEDSQEEQELKKKLLSEMATAYNLKKMRKVLKELKEEAKHLPEEKISEDEIDDPKHKRVSMKMELVESPPALSNIKSKEKIKFKDGFESEQGAGEYINGKPYSESYMGGSGRHVAPINEKTVNTNGKCDVLEKIVQRCRGIDFLAGDLGQLFLPICSTHQICYLCGNALPTTCDLLFVSECDAVCDGDSDCQRAARTALMAMRELHDNLIDELDGECETNPCLVGMLIRNSNWQEVFNK